MPGRRLKIETPKGPVSAALTGPKGGPVVVLGPGAGADMDNAILVGFAEALTEAGIRCLRFNFPYKEAGRGAPDPEPILRATWSAALDKARSLGDPVWAGGKSMGGRIASLVVADGAPVAGLVFVGYPLHPPGKPERIRDGHLPEIEVPMLFLQGTRDPFARWTLMERTIERIGERATLHPVEGGDHSFRVRGESKDDHGTGHRLGDVAARFIREKG